MHATLHSWSFRNHFKTDPSFSILQALDRTAAMGFESIVEGDLLEPLVQARQAVEAAIRRVA